MKYKVETVRIILTLCLIYGVYTETGVWTALSLFLVMTGLELNGLAVKNLNASLKRLRMLSSMRFNIHES
jgi:hypothetical protein